MSYVRWSTDNFQSDVYSYADVRGGYTTSVASSRYIDPDAAKKCTAEFGTDEYEEAHKTIDIGLPFDGQTFNDPTLQTMRERLVMLKDLGYLVPNSAFEYIDADLESGVE